jgi:hypothetical protein
MTGEGAFSQPATEVELNAVACGLASFCPLSNRLAAFAEHMLEAAPALENGSWVCKKKVVACLQALDQAALPASICANEKCEWTELHGAAVAYGFEAPKSERIEAKPFLSIHF